MNEFDYRLPIEVISIGNVDVLVALWQLSFHQGEKGKETRKYIKKALSLLTKELGLAVTKSFREFVEAYDEKVNLSFCTSSPDRCLYFVAKKGRLEKHQTCP